MATLHLPNDQRAKTYAFLRSDPRAYIGNELECRRYVIQAAGMIVDLEFEYVLAGCSYTAQHFRDTIAASGAQAVILPKQNAKRPHEYDTWRYRDRHLV